MKSTKTYPNILWILLNLVFLSFLGMLVLVCFEWIFEFKVFFKNSHDDKIGMIFLLIFILPVLLYFYYQLSNQFTFAKMNPNGIVIFQPLKFKIEKLSIDEIRGYSKSEISYGRIPLNYCSKSVVIYSKNNNPFELIKIFNLNFDAFQSELKKTNITYLGKEGYETEKIYKRKYKYLK